MRQGCDWHSAIHLLPTRRGDPAAQQKEAAVRKHRDFDDLPCFRHHV
jgi:hypothetical protein